MMPRFIIVFWVSVLLGCLLFPGAAAASDPGVEEPVSETPAVQPEGPSLPALSPGEEEKSPADKEGAAEAPEKEGAADTPAKEPQPPAKETSPQSTTPETPAAEPEPPPKRVLTPAMAALRDRVRRTLAYYRGQSLNTQENTATEVMDACLAFGCNTQVYRAGSAGQKTNAIGSLAWNLPCAGRTPLVVSGGHVAARIGFGFQERPAQMLAMLAQSRVPADYPIRVDQSPRSVADLVEYEKASCRAGTDLSLKLIGLAFYADEPTWKNDLGEEWSIERIVQEELGQPLARAADGGTTRLMGLSCAIRARLKDKQPIEGQFDRAQKLIAECQEFALRQQNSDGSWGPNFFVTKAASRDPAVQLRSSGRVLEWLAFSLPEDRLSDPRVVRSVEQLNELLAGSRYQWNVRALNTRTVSSVMHGLHALVIYDERWFKPADVEKPASEGKKAATADRTPPPAKTR